MQLINSLLQSIVEVIFFSKIEPAQSIDTSIYLEKLSFNTWSSSPSSLILHIWSQTLFLRSFTPWHEFNSTPCYHNNQPSHNTYINHGSWQFVTQLNHLFHQPSYSWSKLQICINGIKLHVYKQNDSHMLSVIQSHNQVYPIISFSEFNTTTTNPKQNYTTLMRARTSLPCPIIQYTHREILFSLHTLDSL